MAKTLSSSLIVRLVDQVTAPARKVANSLLGIERAASGTSGTFGTRLNKAIERNNAALDRTRGNLVDAAAGFYTLKAAVGGPIMAAMGFESVMADIAKVTSMSDEELAGFGKRLRQLSATEIPMAVNDLGALAAAAAQAGVPDADLFDFTKLVAKAAVAWDMTGAEAGEALAKIRTALNLTNEQTAAYADAVNFVSDSTAASSRDMIDFTKRVASQGEFFGFAKEQTLAFGAAMISAGAESDVAATSFRNMGKALTKGASATRAQRGAYKALGLDAEKVAKAMQKDAVGTTLKVIERLGKLPEHMQASVMSDLFGDEARALAPLLNNTELLRKALSLTAKEQNYLNSVGKEFEKRAATSEYKLQRFKSQLNAIALTVGGALLPAMNDLMATLGPIALRVADFAEAHPELTRNVVAATGALIAFRVAVISLKFVGLLGRGGALSMLAFGFNTVGKAAIGASKAVRNAVGLQATLAAMSGMKMTGLQTMTTALGAMVRAVPGVSAIGAALSAIGAALGAISAPAWATIAAAVALVAAAGYSLWKYWDRVSAVLSGVAKRVGEELQPAFDMMAPAIEPVKAAIRSLGDGFSWAGQKIGEFVGWISSFFSREVLTEEQKAKYANAGYEVADSLINAIKSASSALIAAGAAMFDNLWAGMKQKWTEVKAWAASLPSQIGSSFTGFFSSGGAAPVPTGGDAGATSGHRATGGPVWPGGSFLVGERGQPEVFTPKTAGTITPVSKLGGGSITIGPFNITGGGDASAVAREVAALVKDELNRALRGAHADMGARA